MQNAIGHLRRLHDELKVDLEHTPRTDHHAISQLVGMMNELDLACQQLQLCEKWGIVPRSIIRVMPPTRCEDSEYRVMDDCESDNRSDWAEVDVDGRGVRFGRGTLIIQP
ncbi:hypothetical protein [Piscinibacter gummiphilus]|uniref:Uncharacterized protein n=1 Tax=Piscinibacter gummiphilus TaxID=946333 RepID=A0A1W6LBY5_9BURK|nr:hypothetical protein [Piscinibacter gummiphilus]ARN21750.1 hypothetical protein A4W93_18640 [Piscinibacter gummiphilus]ATU66433.1 hypothetical protein CPZ87_18725 [Piscinibacter gummiphilus]GLS95675.1 hypothetical protein GCM10007918_29670 [Piscinibacter gummiphilus]